MNNQIDKRFDKEFLINVERFFTLPGREIKAFLHAEVEAARKDERRKLLDEIINAFLKRGKEQGNKTILWTGKEIVEVLEKIKDLEEEL